MELIVVTILFLILVPASLGIFVGARKITGQSYVQNRAAVTLGETNDILRYMRNLDFGIFQEETFTARVGLFETDFPDQGSRRQFFLDLRERLGNRPEISQVALTTVLPGFTASQGPVTIQGMEYQGERDYPRAGSASISFRNSCS